MTDRRDDKDRARGRASEKGAARSRRDRGDRDVDGEVTVSAGGPQNRQQVALRSSFDVMLKDAVSSFQVTERAKAEIVQRQLVQFSEILKIKLRNRLFQYKFKAQQLWASIEQDGGQFFIPDGVHGVHWDTEARGGLASGPFSGVGGSAGPGSASQLASGALSTGASGIRQVGDTLSFLMPSGLGARFVVVGASFLLLSSVYHKVITSWRVGMVIAASAGVRIADLKARAMELERCLNVLLAFEETGEDELENERIVRDVAERLSLRHINHVSKLSKNGQKALATVMVDRVCRHLSRHRFGYADESPVPLMSYMQQLYWWAEARVKRVFVPADKMPQRPRLNLLQRVIRGLSAENADNDVRTLELEPFHQASDGPGPTTRKAWTAAELLSKCAIYVPESGHMYAHEETRSDIYGYAYGTLDEVERRQMRLVSSQKQPSPLSSKL
ncbi:Hypothetical Protein FCC1311_044152 [Hondaea fermentalgiana]|uniref:Uncharacterized protein n=1 Tax=Hondaea fermentalgiana TaxID=2315210 RepID=A0A2R5GB01_9STRA|nr:Hypothetical Protein FCC1311_044152 [Hondaea fermentalgiana]|eukprot:GBG28192.1 Hypothetical Protein FCC1311_044152 [Hondaea fermentalgiana]